MPNPYVAYLIFGRVLNFIGDIVPSASLKVKTSIATKTFTSDDDGLYLFDLADVGYTSGETVKVTVTEPFNNETLDFTFDVIGFFRQSDITLALRNLAIDTIGGSTQTILHSVGNKPITRENALPIFNTTNPVLNYGLAGGDSSNRIFGYLKVNGEWYIQKFDNSTKEYLYIKGSSDFITSWNARTTLDYLKFNEVF